MEKPQASVDEYIANFPQEVKAILEKIRAIIHTVAPDAKEKISYGIPTFTINDKNFMHFSGWEHHISLHPRPHADAELEKELMPYVHGRGTLQFQLSQPIPYDIVEKVAKALAQEGRDRQKD